MEKEKVNIEKLETEKTVKNEKIDFTKRFVDIPYPRSTRATIKDIFDKEKVQIDKLKTHFYEEGRLDIECALKIIENGTKILSKEPNLLILTDPMTGILKF